ERGVWVQPDGSFRIDHLPKGEYALKFHASGFSTEYKNGIFVDDGRVTDLGHEVALYILHPSVDIASNKRVFTSKEQPYFWLNCTGANLATVKLYKTDMLKLAAANGVSVDSEDHPDTKHPVKPSISFGSNLTMYKQPDSREPAFLAKQTP